MTNYQKCKLYLKEAAADLKEKYKDDYPLIRMCLNNELDQLSRNTNLSEHKKELLTRYVCKLHPKSKK